MCQQEKRGIVKEPKISSIMDAQDASHDKVEEQNFEVVNHDNDSIEAQKDNGIIVDSLGRTTKRREDTSSDRVTIKTWIIISVRFYHPRTEWLTLIESFVDSEPDLRACLVAHPGYDHPAILYCGRF